MTVVERRQDADGRVYDAEVPDNAEREVLVGRVTSLSPPEVSIPGRDQPVGIYARAIGLTVDVDDFVLVARVTVPNGERTVAICKVEVL